MSSGANVQSIEALAEFRVALCRFVEAARVSLSEADADLQRHGFWLNDDRQRHWKFEIRKREEKFRQAKMVLLEKKLQKTATGARASCVDEEKALAAAQRLFEEARLKAANTARWVRRLEEQVFQHKGMLQSFNHSLDSDVPNGLAWLDRMLTSLEAYVALAPPTEMPPAPDEMNAMSRPTAGQSDLDKDAAGADGTDFGTDPGTDDGTGNDMDADTDVGTDADARPDRQEPRL